MAKTNYKTINDYHDAFPQDIQERMQTIRELIHKIVPEAVEVISYQVPAFKVGKKFLIYYAAFAKHITLSNPWSEDLLNEFATELKSYKVTKAAIHLLDNKPLPLEFITLLLKFRKKEVEITK